MKMVKKISDKGSMLMKKKFDLLVAGEINPDLILSDPNLVPMFGQQEILVDEADLTIGSSNAIFACGAARLGLNPAMIGVVGEDIFGSFMRQSLEAREVDVSYVIVNSEIKTGFSVILNRTTDRAILSYLGAMDALKAEDVTDEILSEVRHLHVASYFLQTALQPGLPDLFQRARRLGVTISLDPNWDPEERWEGFDELLPLIDIFFPNEAELLSITRSQNVQDGISKLSQLSSTVAVKLGSQGSIVQRNDLVIRFPAIPVRLADTVGAGDSFDAGFVYGYLQGWSLERCTQMGIVCGSLSTRDHGGTAAQPFLEEALQVIKQYF